MWRKLSALVVVFLAASILALPALAGGWAVITLDAFPEDVSAGQQVSVGFTVLQHGRTPMHGLTPLISFRNPESGETRSVVAESEGPTGHYVAAFTLPSAGNWEWSIEAFTVAQPMPALVVAAPAMPDISAANLPAETPAKQSSLIIGLAGIALAGLALAYALRRRSRWALAVVALGLLISGAGFARAGLTSASARSPVISQPPAEQAPAASIETGETLFVAKGCLTCHRNDRVDGRYTVFTTEIGPDLTAFKTSSEYLHLWLSNPASVKPGTEMPDLQLSEAEIEALAAFILDQPAH